VVVIGSSFPVDFLPVDFQGQTSGAGRIKQLASCSSHHA